MSDVVLVKRRIKPGKTDSLREWMEEITSHCDEAIETLQHERMLSETAFLEQRDDGDYLLYYMEAEDLDHVFESFESSPYEIDHEHQAVLDEVLADDQPDQDIEPLYHLANPDR